jgi:hypothetical protein
MKDLNLKLENKIKQELRTYRNHCISCFKENHNILSSGLGRKALKLYFQAHQQDGADMLMFSLVETFEYMRRVQSDRGGKKSEPTIK